MSPETDILAPAPAWTDEMAERCRADGRNHVWKRETADDLRRRLTSDVLLMENVIGGPTPERITAMRAHCSAKLAWLDANPGDDLNDKSVAAYLSICRQHMRTLTELKSALSWVAEIEDNSLNLEKKSDTRANLERRVYDEERDAARWLEKCLTIEQAAFLGELLARSWRRHPRFRMYRDHTRDSGYSGTVMIDLRARVSRGSVGFEDALSRASTLAEVKRLLALWHTDATVSLSDGVKVFKGEGFTIFPA